MEGNGHHSIVDLIENFLVIHVFSSPWPCDRRRSLPYSACKVSVLDHRGRQRETRHEGLERGEFFEMRNVLHRLLHQL